MESFHVFSSGSEVHRNGPGTIYSAGTVGLTVSRIYSDRYLTYRYRIYFQFLFNSFIHSISIVIVFPKKKLSKSFGSNMRTTKLVIRQKTPSQ